MTETNDLFQRPANYWLHRARQLWSSGSPLRAAVLQRHAVRAEPDHEAACMTYAFTLRRLGCYEASNREAFAALARHPERSALFGLIGQNMFDLGFRQEGYDAMDAYLANPPDIPPEWQDEAYDLLDAMEREEPLRGRSSARLDGLLRIAARRTAQNDLQTAERAIRRAYMRPFRAPHAGRELMAALYLQQGGQERESAERLAQAVALSPRSPEILACAASLYQTLGIRKKAVEMLLRGAKHAATPDHRRLVCHTADELHLPGAAYAMLCRMHRQTPNAFSVCYDLCVCLSHMGKMEEAARYANLCREIDPDDVQGQWLFAQMDSGGEAKSWPYYGLPDKKMLDGLLAPVLDGLTNGTLADQLTSDRGIRDRLLYLLALPMDIGMWALASVAPALDRDELIALLRQTLTAQPLPTPGKQYALMLLQGLGEPPPYLMWQGNRLLRVDPTAAQPQTPLLWQRVLAMRIRQAQRLCPGQHGLTLWALKLAGRMDAACRRSLLRDAQRVWPAALAMAYRSRMGLAPLHTDPDLEPMRAAALQKAVFALQFLDCQGGTCHEDH